MATIKEVKLNNKSRKGTYLRISETKQPTRYYKKNEEIENQEDMIKQYYEDSMQKKRTGNYKQYAARRLKRTSPTARKLDEHLKKGKWETIIRRINYKSRETIRYEISKQMKKLMKTKDLARIMNETNMQKQAKRFSITVEGYTDQGKKVIAIQKIGRTPQQIADDISTRLNNRVITQHEIDYPDESETLKYLNLTGYKKLFVAPGRITHVMMNVKYRKNA